MSEQPSQAGERGEMLLEISNTIVGLQKQFFGKGPTKARTYFAGPDLIVTLMGGGHTAVEETLYQAGKKEAVAASRMAFQNAMEERTRDAIESVTGRKVVAFMSGTTQHPDFAAELFVLEPEPGDYDSPVRVLDEPSPS